MTKQIVRETPWDKPALGMDTYELMELSEEAMQKSEELTGHFTIKVDPLESKRLLHEYGFYYTDTLITPVCTKEKFTPYSDGKALISKEVSREEIVGVSKGAYRHGRFHRDFMLDKSSADLRYDRWLGQLYDEGNVWGLFYEGKLAGFFAYSGNQVLLQAFKPEFQGRGLSKYFWSPAVDLLFEQGYDTVSTSISAANLAMLNLVVSLGFKFTEAVDVYQKLNK